MALDENITNQAHNQVNNYENHHVANETQPVMAPPELLGAPHDDRGGRASPLLHRSSNRERGGSRRCLRPLPFCSQPAATVAMGVYESDSHRCFAARTESGVRVLEQAQRAHGTEGNNMEPDVALDENITNQANALGNHACWERQTDG